MVPCTKYFCTKGYTQMIGMVANTIHAAFRISGSVTVDIAVSFTEPWILSVAATIRYYSLSCRGLRDTFCFI